MGSRMHFAANSARPLPRWLDRNNSRRRPDGRPPRPMHFSTHSTEAGVFGYWPREHMPARTAGSSEPRPGGAAARWTRWTTDRGSRRRRDRMARRDARAPRGRHAHEPRRAQTRAPGVGRPARTPPQIRRLRPPPGIGPPRAPESLRPARSLAGHRSRSDPRRLGRIDGATPERAQTRERAPRRTRSASASQAPKPPPSPGGHARDNRVRDECAVPRNAGAGARRRMVSVAAGQEPRATGAADTVARRVTRRRRVRRC